MASVIIVVPLYTAWLSPLENISLMQLYRVLGAYPICFVMPERMREKFMGTALWCEFFPDAYFLSVKSYSHFCLEPEFYERFADYDYMLLYQTDAFVFRDELLDWCGRGYDYIGAPWPRFFVRTLPVRYRSRVGNGGFSLRKIAAMQRILLQKKEILAHMPRPDFFLDREDTFWAYCGSVSTLGFHLPEEKLARKFSLEGGVDGCARHLRLENLPFGCHGWTRSPYYRSWKKWIANAGYEIPDAVENPSRDLDIRQLRILAMQKYILERLERRQDGTLSMLLQNALAQSEKRISLYGWGVYGKRVYRMLKHEGWCIAKIYDKRYVESEQFEGVPIVSSDSERKLYTPLLITTIQYEDEICQKLNVSGYGEQRIYRLSVVLQKIIDEIWQKMSVR